MIDYINAEIYKFRKTKIFYALLLLLIPSIILFMMYGFNEKYGIVKWEEYINSILTFLNDIVAPIIYGIIAAYIFGHDYEARTLNVLFTYPIKRLKLLFSKLAAIFIIIALSLIFVFIFSIATGLLLKHENLGLDILAYYGAAFLKMIVYHFMLVCITGAVAICVKSVLPAAIFVISATFVNIVIVNTHAACFYPWSAPVLLSPHENVGRSFVPSKIALFVLFISFLIALGLSIKKYRYIE